MTDAKAKALADYIARCAVNDAAAHAACVAAAKAAKEKP